MSEMVFACRLDALDATERRRYAALRASMRAAVENVAARPDGYTLRLRADAVAFRDASEWITLERRCCPFLALGLEWSDANTVWLRMTGAPGVKAFLTHALGVSSAS